MRKTLISAVSGIAILLSGAAIAASNSDEMNAGSNAGQVEGQAPAASETMPSSEDTATGAVEDTNAEESEDSTMSSEQVAPATDSNAAATGTKSEDTSKEFGSYSRSQSEFSGEIAGGYSAEELIGRDIVTASGDEVGEIVDLLIDENDKISKVLVDVGGFLGLGAKTVALDIEELSLSQGSGGEYVTSLTEDQLKSLPEYSESEQGWSIH